MMNKTSWGKKVNVTGL